MRKWPLLFLPLIAGCTNEVGGIGNQLLTPLNGLGTAITNTGNTQTRGQVEVFVKTNHLALIADLRAGGGPTLAEAFDIANVPQSARVPHTLQLQSNLQLYESNLDALVIAIMVSSG